MNAPAMLSAIAPHLDVDGAGALEAALRDAASAEYEHVLEYSTPEQIRRAGTVARNYHRERWNALTDGADYIQRIAEAKHAANVAP